MGDSCPGIQRIASPSCKGAYRRHPYLSYAHPKGENPQVSGGLAGLRAVHLSGRLPVEPGLWELLHEELGDTNDGVSDFSKSLPYGA